jgi:3',5'-cyclic-AMP phosphodiesterase
MATKGKHFVIAQFSDIHCGDPRFDGHLLEKVIRDVNRLEPDLVVVPGDLTTNGYRDEYEQALSYIEQLECPEVVVIPGNHDSRNVGYLHFLELFGKRWNCREMEFGIAAEGVARNRMRVISVDSSKPDLDDGEVGRHRYDWLSEQLGPDEEEVFKLVAVHHHLVGIPGTGRERNIVLDAGDVLEIFAQHHVDIVLAGHKHVPYVWPVSGLLVITSGTAATWRTRGNIPPSYNVITIDGETVVVEIVESDGEGRTRLEYALKRPEHRRGAGAAGA